jgi:hypothetical protein
MNADDADDADQEKRKTLTTEDAEEHRGGSEEPKAKG